MLTFFGDCKMAKKKTGQSSERNGVKTVDILNDSKCIACGAKYESTKTVYNNGDVVISPQRCIPCQTAHLTNLRVNKTIKDIQLLGNLKLRLSDIQRQAILDVISNEFNGLCDRYSGSVVKASAFDLKKVKTQ